MARKHGSLAHAGKVRAQTPKVPKDENKKRKAFGRAGKRAVFVRRYCVKNTVEFGRKKTGPNRRS